jgi:hypothetical protein
MSQALVLAADEVGLGFGRLGPYVLRSQAQPVFRRRGAWLRPEAARIRTAAFRDGTAVEWGAFLADVDPLERPQIDAACRRLDIENHVFISSDPIELILGTLHDGADGPDLELVRHPRHPFGDPGPVCFPLSAANAHSDAILRSRAGKIRAAGMRVCLGDIAARIAIDDCLEEIRPDVVRIEAAWFARLAGEASLRRLLSQMVERLHRCDAEVLVEGADDGLRLGAALEAGADLIAGESLAAFALVGTPFDTSPREVASLLTTEGNVVPVAFLQRTHQYR